MSVRYERRWLAECVQPENNHDKFYEIFFIDAPMGGEYTVVFHWGRRGGKGQSQVVRTTSRDEAENAFIKKQNDKLREYVTVAEDGPGYLPQAVEEQMERLGDEFHRLYPPITKITTPEELGVDIANFVQDLLLCATVTPAMATQRTDFLEQMDKLKRAISEAEASADLMDAVYRKRLG